jgi:hypothetical protein
MAQDKRSDLSSSRAHSMEKIQHLKFPYKLHYLLEHASPLTSLDRVISWTPCGTAFTVHDIYAFVTIVMPIYFPGMASYKSFRRQLNLYGMTQRGSKKNLLGKSMFLYRRNNKRYSTLSFLLPLCLVVSSLISAFFL